MSIRQRIGQRTKDRRGFTLAELVVAMAVGSLVMGGVFLVYNQLFSVTAVNSNYMAAFRQVQNAGDWITNDTLTAQEVYGSANTTLTSNAEADDDEISVSSTADFPDSGIICIENEIIQYASKDDTNFYVYDDPGTTELDGRPDAAAHDPGTPATSFLCALRTDWDSNRHLVVYTLTDDREMVRISLTMDSGSTDWARQSSSIIAEAIEDTSNSDWNPAKRELEVELTANVGGFIMGRFGEQTFEASRTYKIHPRPFI